MEKLKTNESVFYKECLGTYSRSTYFSRCGGCRQKLKEEQELAREEGWGKTAVSGAMGSSGVAPLLFEEVPIFNVTGGYGNFIIPGVVILIIQQALLLGVGMIAGTRREKLRYGRALKDQEWKITGMLGHSLAYLMLFSVMLAWITLIVPRIFGFVSLVHGPDLFHFLVPYLLACVFFAITVTQVSNFPES